MSRGTTRRSRRKESNLPSRFFMIALTVGVLFLVIAFFLVLRNPHG